MQVVAISSPPSLPPATADAAPAESSGGYDAFEKVMEGISDRDTSKEAVQEISVNPVAEKAVEADSETTNAPSLLEEPADEAEAGHAEDLPLPIPAIWALISAPSPANLSMDAASPVGEAFGLRVQEFSPPIINPKGNPVADAIWDQSAQTATATSTGSPTAAESPADLVARSVITSPSPIQAQITTSVPVAKAKVEEKSAVNLPIADGSTEISVNADSRQVRSMPPAFTGTSVEGAGLPAYWALTTSTSETEQATVPVSAKAPTLAAVVDATEVFALNSGLGDVPAPVILRSEPAAPPLPAISAHGTVGMPNAAMPLPLPPGIGADMAAVVARQPDGPVEIRLSPEELGRLKMSLSTEGDILRVTVQVERPDTLDLLRRNSDVLIQELRSAGFSGTSLSFSTWGGSAQGDSGATGSGPAPSRSAEVSSIPPSSTQPASKQGLDIRL